MPAVKFKGNPVTTKGNLPSLHTKAPEFRLIDKNLEEHTLEQFKGKRKLLATVPSLDTSVCSTMTKHINDFATKHREFVCMTVSADLPFAQNRFCEQEGIDNVLTLSTIRDHKFGENYGVLMVDGPLEGLLARSIFVLDEKDDIIYEELVLEITEEPNYHKATECLLKNR